ncbi:hypothetical protein G6F16_009651 [Rhizopus arrhizus]|uniref:YEATS domain-containing protein n=1 Tax=Rhizopus oryzae TaxID=64495 RepID=A0A9P6X0I8_RHIOR|nr:hypothetical protein G6F22_007125 [Rhizopus arrhizus]KAG0790272.1 hypothetical protein G6F21_005932 [Rhizopus arrhizus]KAG0806487.1 hypothetical protein G6F20_011086 [Rhizopus arrhizus]KAG0822904.1 hypothetical protein G6F19_011117 [Rhizopus arrhizus]KAG0823856.1 hypothetical protein G6F18_011117 [Rhizopus arrhizus]
MTSVFQEFKISCHNSIIRGASAQSSDGHPWRNWQVTLVAMEDGKEVKGKSSLILDHVEYILHPTFDNPRRIMKKEPYLLQEKGWGEFDLRALLHFTNNLAAPKIIVFDLNFAQPTYSVIEKIEFPNASAELVHLLSLKPASPTIAPDLPTKTTQRPVPKTAHLSGVTSSSSNRHPSGVTSSSSNKHPSSNSAAARQTSNGVSSASSRAKIGSPTRTTSVPRRSSTSSKEAPSSAKAASSSSKSIPSTKIATTASNRVSSPTLSTSSRDSSPPSRSSSSKASTPSRKFSSSDKMLLSTKSDSSLSSTPHSILDKAKLKQSSAARQSTFDLTQEKSFHDDSSFTSPKRSNPSKSTASKKRNEAASSIDSRRSSSKSSSSTSKSTRPSVTTDPLKAQTNIYSRSTNMHNNPTPYVSSKLQETHLPSSLPSSPSADNDSHSLSGTNSNDNSNIDVHQINDYVNSPHDLANIHLIHSGEVDFATQAAWDIPNIDMAQLAMRISVLRGQDNERLQDIIVANETDDMEFYIENGSIGYNLYSFGARLLQAMWNFTDTIPYIREVETHLLGISNTLPNNSQSSSQSKSSQASSSRGRQESVLRASDFHLSDFELVSSDDEEDSKLASETQSTSNRESQKRPLSRPAERHRVSESLQQQERNQTRHDGQSRARQLYRGESSSRSQSPRRSYHREESSRNLSPRRSRDESNYSSSPSKRVHQRDEASSSRVPKRLYQREENDSNRREDNNYHSRKTYQRDEQSSGSSHDQSPRKRKYEDDDTEESADDVQRSDRSKPKPTKMRKH